MSKGDLVAGMIALLMICAMVFVFKVIVAAPAVIKEFNQLNKRAY